MKTDRRLKQDVEEELDWTPEVDSSKFAVEVKDGIVTLVGHPSSYAEKLAAEKGVQRVSGVKAMVIEAEVRLPAKDVIGDADIAGGHVGPALDRRAEGRRRPGSGRKGLGNAAR
jgi:hypothetical protein